MDIGNIGNINDKMYNNTLNTTKEKVVGDAFEKHLKNAMEKKDDKELKKACQEFESVLLNMLYKEMKATVPKSEFLPGDYGKEVFDSMLDDKLVEEASKNNSFGLANTLFKQLSKQLKTVEKQNDGGNTGSVEKK